MEILSTIYEKITNALTILVTFIYESFNEYIVTILLMFFSYIINPQTKDIRIVELTGMVVFIVVVSLCMVFIPYTVYTRKSAAKTGKIPELSGRYKGYYDRYMTSLMWCGITLLITLFSYFIHYTNMDYISIPYISNSSVRLIGLGGIGAGITSFWVFYNSFYLLDIKRSMI